MLKTRGSSTVALATAAALLFGGLAMQTVSAEEATVQCMGVNACKGQSACKTASSACKGLNSCKGQGFVEMTKANCDSAKAEAKTKAM